MFLRMAAEPSVFHADVEFELPTARPFALQALEFERAEFGDHSLEIYWHQLTGVTVRCGQRGLDGRDFFELVVVDGIFEHVTGLVLSTKGGGKESETRRF